MHKKLTSRVYYSRGHEVQGENTKGECEGSVLCTSILLLVGTEVIQSPRLFFGGSF